MRAVFYHGTDYLLKMQEDLAFLPAPAAVEPLLISWFAERASWAADMLAADDARTGNADGARQASLELARELAPCFGPAAGLRVHADPRSSDAAAGPSRGERGRLEAAQAYLLEEAARKGGEPSTERRAAQCVATAASAARADADARYRPSAGGGTAARWRWSAYQMLLYGSECYASLAAQLPEYLRWVDLHGAAKLVQRRWRSRLLLRFTRISRQVVAAQRQRQAAERHALESRWASRIQRRYRGKQVRDALRALVTLGLTQDREARRNALAEVRARQEQREQRQLMDRAARRLQKRSRVFSAKALFADVVAQRRAEAAAAAVSLLSASEHVAKLESVMARHRIVKGVLREVYAQVCLSYEVAALERDTAAARAADWFTRVQEAAEEGAAAQVDVQARLAALVEEMDGGRAAISGSAAKAITLIQSREGGRGRGGGRGGGGGGDGTSGAEGTGLPADPVGIYEAFAAAAASAAALVEQLQAEVTAWQQLREKAAGEPVIAELLGRRKHEQSERGLHASRELRTVQQAEAEHRWRGAPELGGRAAPLRAGQAATLLNGATAAIGQAAEWGVPGCIAQAALLASVHAGVAAAAAAEAGRAAAVEKARSAVALLSGEASVLRELGRLFDGLDARTEALRQARVELADYGVTVKLRQACAHLPAAELAGELSPGLPPPPQLGRSSPLGRNSPPPVANGEGGATATGAAEWDGWLSAAEAAHAEARAQLQRGEARRAAAVGTELKAAREELARATARLASAEEPTKAWLHAEGGLRIFTSIQAKARSRLRREMLAKRSATFRQLFALPTHTRVASKRASRELRLASAAATVAEQVERAGVQTRRYTEGTITLIALDSTAPAIAELRTLREEDELPEGDSDEPFDGVARAMARAERREQHNANALAAQRTMLRALHMLVGELGRAGGPAGVDRLHIQTLMPTTATPGSPRSPRSPPPWSPFGKEQVADEPATLLVLAVRRKAGEGTDGGPKTAASVVEKLAEAHRAGVLADTMGVPPSSIREFSVERPKEWTEDAPSVLQLRQEAEERREAARQELDRLAARKAKHRENERVWHRVKGALAHLKNVDALQLAAGKGDGGHKGGGAAAPPEGSAQGFVSKWLGVRDMMRAHVALVLARRDKEARQALKDEIAELDGRIGLLGRLQESCMEWKPVCVPGSDTVIDVRWNVGLSEGAGEREACFCYHCASLSPPVRVIHRFVDCPKRRRAQLREFSSGAIAEASAELVQRTETSSAVLDELSVFGHVRDSGAGLKRELLELAGAIKVLGRQDAVLPRPPPPPPPPYSTRQHEWQLFLRRRRHTTEHIIKMMVVAARQESGAVHFIHGSWGELKAAALMKPQEHVISTPLTPEMVVEVGQSIGLDISPTGEDYHMLDLAIELARAPIPGHWEMMAEIDEGEGQGAGKGASDALLAARAMGRRRFVNVLNGEECVGHPMAPAVRKLAAGLKARSQRTGFNKPRPLDVWVQFADVSNRLPFFYNFATEERTRDFPEVPANTYTPSVAPKRRLEPSAEVLAAAALQAWPERDTATSERLERVTKAALWDAPRRRARGEQLAHLPCRVETLVQQGFALGLDPSQHRDLMWLADVALAPEVPVGWIPCTALGAEDEATFYWSVASGLTQWEHPEVSFISGVATRLVSARQRDLSRALGEAHGPPLPAADEQETHEKVEAALGIEVATEAPAVVVDPVSPDVDGSVGAPHPAAALGAPPEPEPPLAGVPPLPLPAKAFTDAPPMPSGSVSARAVMGADGSVSLKLEAVADAFHSAETESQGSARVQCDPAEDGAISVRITAQSIS